MPEVKNLESRYINKSQNLKKSPKDTTGSGSVPEDPPKIPSHGPNCEKRSGYGTVSLSAIPLFPHIHSTILTKGLQLVLPEPFSLLTFS